MDETYTFEYGIECPVARRFAWRFWTNVNNWGFDKDIESVELNGAFTSGSHGVTRRKA